MKKFFLVLLSVLYCPLVFRGLFQLGMGLPYGGALLNLGYPALAAAYFLLAGMALKRAGIGDGKLAILRAIAHNEDSPQGLVERLDVLRRTIEEKAYDAGCRFLLSTIHAS